MAAFASARPLAPRVVCGCSVAWALLASGCVIDSVDAPEDQVGWLAMRAAEVRQLDYLREVPVVWTSPEAYAAAQQQDADEVDEAELEEFAQTWGRLGYFAPDTDLRGEIAVSREWVGGFYSSEDGSITLIGQPRQALVVHEHVHALQDQHFEIEPYLDQQGSDAALSRRAVTEGDAMLAEMRFYVQQEGFDLESTGWNLDIAREQSEAVLDEATLPVLQASRSFVYYYGFEYCLANLTGYSIDSEQYTRPTPFDWSREDQLFQERAPITAWEVLMREGSPPAGWDGIGIDDVPADLAGDLELVGTDTLGAWYAYVLLRPVDGEPGVDAVRSIPDAWRGDRVLFVRGADRGDHGLVWASAWSDEAAATRVAEAYRLLHGAVLDDETSPFAGAAADGEPMWIERRGERVVALKNVRADLAPALAEAAFAGAASAGDSSIEPPPDGSAAQRKLGPWLKRLVGTELVAGRTD